MLPLDNLWVIGNHGMEMRPPHGVPVSHPDAHRYRPRLRQAYDGARALALRTPGAICEGKGWSVSLHYRVVSTDVAPLVSAMEQIGAATGLRVLHGKQVTELRPPIDVNKGTASAVLARQIGALSNPGSVLYAGDDRTDEDAFRILRERNPDAVTIRIAGADEAERDTAAEFVLDSVAALRNALARLLALRS
jgi:trehalose-phosphatase